MPWWQLAGPGIVLLTAVGFVAWDRRSPISASPDKRMIRIGVVLTAVGAVSSFFLWWWALVPVVVLLVGATMIVVGRHRVVAAG